MKSENETGTNFTSGKQTSGGVENGRPELPLMSEAGKKLAEKSAPTTATKNATGGEKTL
jgi:hypothetical protein